MTSSSVFIVNFEPISYFFSGVSILDYEQQVIVCLESVNRFFKEENYGS